MTRENQLRERALRFQYAHRAPQVAFTVFSKAVSNERPISAFSFSVFIRGGALAADTYETLQLTLDVMEELVDSAKTPIDWRRSRELRPQIAEIAARLRRERSAELHRRFEGTRIAPALA